MAIKFPKKQQQCLIPKYLLEYSEELAKNHPDPSADWGGGGGSPIEAGEGIVITGDETKTISVDTETIPTVAELSTVAFSGSYNDLSNKPDLSVYELKEDAFSGDYNDLTNKPTIPTATSQLTNDSGFITGVTWNDVTGKPTFATVATSGSYNDLSNKPSIPNSTSAPFLGVGQASDGLVLFSLTGASGTYYKYVEAQSGIKVNLQALNPKFGTGLTSSYDSNYGELNVAVDTTTIALKSDIPDSTSDLTNDSGFITSASLTNYVPFETVSGMKYVNAGNYYGQGYEPGFVNTNMLTQTKNTFKLPVDKSGTIALTSDIPSMPTNYVTTDTAQTITARKTIVGASEGLYIQSGPNWTSSDTMILPGQVSSNSISGTTVSAGELVFADITTTGQGQIRVRDFNNNLTDYRITVPAKTGTMALTSDITNVSGTNDGTNWTTLTIGSDTYGIGGGSTPSNMVTTDTAQNITGAKTFLGVDVLKLQGTASISKPGFAVNESDGTKRGFLELRPASGDKTMVLGVTNGVPGHSDFRPGFREFNNTSNYTYSALLPLGSNKYTTFGTGNMNMVLGVNGVKAGADGNIVQATETLTFTYSDNTTATFTFVKV